MPGEKRLGRGRGSAASGELGFRAVTGRPKIGENLGNDTGLGNLIWLQGWKACPWHPVQQDATLLLVEEVQEVPSLPLLPTQPGDRAVRAVHPAAGSWGTDPICV